MKEVLLVNPPYQQFYGLLKQWDETTPIAEISQNAIDFLLQQLSLQRVVIFIHNDKTGLFEVKYHGGFEEHPPQVPLQFVKLLLSGDIIDTLRTQDTHLVIDESSDWPTAVKFIQSIGFTEAYFELFGGDQEAPYGLIMAGNHRLSESDSATVEFEFSDQPLQTFLKLFMLNFSNSINNALFYRAWLQEKERLNDNIRLRTQELGHQKEYLEAIYQSVQEGIAVIDLQTTGFIDANRAYCELTGLTIAELKLTSCLALTDEDFKEITLNALEEVKLKGVVNNLIKSCQVKHPGNEEPQKITVNMSMVLMKDKQQVLMTASDITARIAMENQLKEFAQGLERKVEERTAQLEDALQKANAAAKAKSDFLATMSHEIRTPMNGVMGMTNLLFDTPLDKEQQHYLEVLQNSGKTLLNIINDVLDFSKIDAGMLSMEKVAFSLPQLLSEVQKLYQPQADEKGLELKISLEEGMEQYLGDPTRLRQVMFNLVSNAIKFTTRGQVAITVRSPSKQDCVWFQIQDTGVGIPESVLPRLFTPFTQADASITRKFGGTGLGLAICKKLVELMGGEISVSSQANQGSIFEFSLPLIPISPTNHQPFERQAAEHFQNQSILLVEDNKVNQLLAKKLLEKFGLNVTVANDGVEALEVLAQQPFKVVLMDMQMPRMDGLTAAREIRKMAIPQPVIIALTANAFLEDRIACKEAGMDDFISKPIEIDVLKSALTKAFPSR
ncbi:ATP-binding protein [Thiomicrorhabdus indica]|uniref:ATP-binding protein n=1 Tax=Thiomicrorhabdus indica TaxID=2267253 RepID=UPI002AA6FF23|nr:ATP-binding protein [Thiomicrorhabdus indica]